MTKDEKEIHLYDIANAKWYTQTATGDVPDMRRRFCAGVSALLNTQFIMANLS
jgi:hypothetical protein